jgi:hypothetical protein
VTDNLLETIHLENGGPGVKNQTLKLSLLSKYPGKNGKYTAHLSPLLTCAMADVVTDPGLSHSGPRWASEQCIQQCIQ